MHLHQNHFRFEQQDGNFSYESEAKEFLHHLRERTVPGEPFLSEFYKADVPFRSGCLIVEVHNHRTKGANGAGGNATNQVGATDHKPFSIHNYNEHITPSPFAKFPEHKAKAPASGDGEKEKDKEKEKEAQKEKEPMSAPEQPASAMQKKGNAAPQVTRRVLFPTQETIEYDLMRLSQTPLVERGSSAGPSAATPILGQPPTPMTAAPTTPKPGQRMVLDASNAKEWEAEIINYTAPRLILNPAADLESSIEIIKQLEDPRHMEEPPLPRGRKRTVAEMAADDAQAEITQRYMLSSDERHQSMLSSGVAGAADGATRTGVSGEAQFKRFRLIENLKMAQADAKRLEAEKEASRANLKRQEAEANQRKVRERQEVMEQQARLMQENERQRREFMQQQQLANQQRAAAAAVAQQANNPQQQMQAGNAAQHAMQQNAVQASNMSPIVRQQTPMSASPTLGNGTPISTAAAMTSVPMATSASNQGAGSPPRPPSAVQHPGGGVNMMRQASQQASAHGTPQMHSTPSMGNAAPVTRHMTSTPQPRVNQHGSPMPAQMQTPQMMNMTPMPQGITPEQQQMIMRQRMAAQAQAQAQVQAQQQGGGGNAMSPQQMNQMLQMQRAQQGGQMNPQMMNQAQRMMAQQMAAQQQANGGSPQQQGQQNPMAAMNQQIAAIMTGVPQPVAAKLMQLRQEGQNQISQQEQLRKQQFISQFQNQGISPPQDAVQRWQQETQAIRLQSMNQMRSKLVMVRNNLMQTYAAQSGQQQNGGMPQQQGGAQSPGPQGQGGQQGNQQYMQELMMQRQRMAAQNQARMMAQQGGQGQQNGQQGGQGQMMRPGQGMQQMNPQQMMAMAQAQAQQNGGGGGMNMQQMQNMGMNMQQMQNMGMNMQQMQNMGMQNGMGQGGMQMSPQQQAAFMQQMRMQQMQAAQQAGQGQGGMGGFNMGGMMQ